MEYSENFFGFTFPENQLFGAETIKTVNIIWKNWLKQGFSKMNNFLGLAFRYSPERFEKACRRARFYGTPTIGKVQKILELGLDDLSLDPGADCEGQYLLCY